MEVRAVFVLNATEEFRDALNKCLKLNKATLVDVIVIEQVHDNWPCYGDILPFALDIELVDYVLVHEGKLLSREKLKGRNELLCRYELW